MQYEETNKTKKKLIHRPYNRGVLGRLLAYILRLFSTVPGLTLWDLAGISNLVQARTRDVITLTQVVVEGSVKQDLDFASSGQS
jgi:hypothetical protein